MSRITLSLLVSIWAAASQALAVVPVSNEDMFRSDVNEAKARAKNFTELQKSRNAGDSSEQKAIEQYKSREKAALHDEEKAREAYVRERNRRPTGKEDELERKWQEAQDQEEQAHDHERAQYMKALHRAERTIESEAYINPMAEYDLQDPKTPPVSDYLKAHPVKAPQVAGKLAPGGAVVVPGAEKLSSPPPGGSSDF